MRNLLLAFLLLLSVGASAQHGTIREAQAQHSEGYHYAQILTLTGVDAALVNKLWPDYLKKYIRKTEKIKRSEEWFSDDASIPELSNNTIDVYAIATPFTTGVDFYVWFDLGGAYLNQQMHQDKIPATHTLLTGFANLVEREKLALQLKTQEEELKQQEKLLSDLQKSQSAQEKSIEQIKAELKKAEEEFARMKSEESKQKALIKAQQERIGETKRTISQLKKQ
jgi:hypothetical protein